MYLRRRVKRNFSAITVPAICCAVCLYFGYAGIFGERGLMAWSQTRNELTSAKGDLATIRARREALEHRISLLDGRAIDADLLEEVARSVLLETGRDEVAIPREKR
ncbi:MAG: FtsB family cell division protein [Hyphomicrobiaceae bacterium]